jgi:opacity protein-like surface antigen
VKTRALLFVAAAVATTVGTAPAARAAGEREWQTSLRAGAGTVNVDGRRPWGFALGLDLEFGLTDSWALRASAEYSRHGVSPENMDDMRPTGTVRATAALAGLTYTFDILRLVPYAVGQLGVVRFDGAVTAPQTVFAAQLGAGADYFITRKWTAGASFQYLFAPADLAADPLNLGSSPFCFTTTIRASRIF